MDLNRIDLGAFMDDVARAGVTVMIRLDDVRLRLGGKGWTALISGAFPGTAGTIRWDHRSLTECLESVREAVADRGLNESVWASVRANPTAADIEDLFEKLGALGVALMIQVDHALLEAEKAPWQIVVTGPFINNGVLGLENRRNLQECVNGALTELRRSEGEWGWLDLYL